MWAWGVVIRSFASNWSRFKIELQLSKGISCLPAHSVISMYIIGCTSMPEHAIWQDLHGLSAYILTRLDYCMDGTRSDHCQAGRSLCKVTHALPGYCHTSIYSTRKNRQVCGQNQFGLLQLSSELQGFANHKNPETILSILPKASGVNLSLA